MTTSTPLSHDECDRLLRAGTFGRIALTTPGGPEIVPVNYRVVGDDIVVRTSSTSMLGRWADGALVSFEVDLVDYPRWVGWSVIARGVASVVSDADGESGALAAGPRPWADGVRDAVVRIPWTALSGRQLGTGWDAYGSMPARTTPIES